MKSMETQIDEHIFNSHAKTQTVLEMFDQEIQTDEQDDVDLPENHDFGVPDKFFLLVSMPIKQLLLSLKPNTGELTFERVNKAVEPIAHCQPNAQQIRESHLVPCFQYVLNNL